MFEFDTVSASSYDPSALASKLTQKSAEGWEVISIVPTGGDVTAFVRREASGAAPVAAAPADTVTESTSMWSDTTTATYTPEPAATYTPEPAATPVAEEPAGWGAAPEATSTWGSDAAATYTPEPAATYTPEPAATYTPEPAATYTPEPAATYTPEPAATYTPEPAATYTPEPAATYTPEPAAEAAAPAYDPTPTQQVPSVPAGWYADPAGRFELRYWDGGQWTEHVARGGAQYTDPPVA